MVRLLGFGELERDSVSFDVLYDAPPKHEAFRRCWKRLKTTSIVSTVSEADLRYAGPRFPALLHSDAR